MPDEATSTRSLARLNRLAKNLKIPMRNLTFKPGLPSDSKHRYQMMTEDLKIKPLGKSCQEARSTLKEIASNGKVG